MHISSSTILTLVACRRNFSWRYFMSSRHAITPRGLNATRSPLSQGRFGRMFRNLTPAKFGPNEADNIANLAALADNMVGDFDPPKDGPDAEESGIPRSTLISASSS